jgi:hypothetical protein
MRFAWVPVYLVAGCSLYFGDSENDLARCAGGEGGGGQYDPAALSLRDPQTGTCMTVSSGAAEDCNDGVGGAPAPSMFPDWGSCASYCDGLAETQCLSADGCRAIYVAYDTDGPSGAVRAFAGCWSTAQSGPLRGGVCEGRDAQDCSRYDDCSAVHENAADQPGSFRSCVSETICDGAFEQPTPVLRNPETGSCEYGAGGGGVDPCASGVPAPVADWGECGSVCEAYDELTCKSSDGCRAIYADTCAPWLDCVSVDFVGCWPIAPSGPSAAGVCKGLASYECSLHNDCIAEHAQDWSACAPGSPCTPLITSFLACRQENLE